MKYGPQTIKIACTDGHYWMVPGVVAVGSPLGYHYDLAYPDILVVTQLETGEKVPGALAFEEDQIQLLIEILLAHSPWTTQHIHQSPVKQVEAVVEQAMSEANILKFI